MISVFDAFNQQADAYDAWFDLHANTYQLELAALKEIHIHNPGTHIEIGCGTGRFGAQLGFDIGIDPCIEMLQKCRKRGLRVAQALGEQLPFSNNSVASVLMVTTLCFTKYPERVLDESFRILKPEGCLYLGFIPADSELGIRYQAKAKDHSLYKFAHIRTTHEITKMCRNSGFVDYEYRQTLLPNQSASVLTGFGIGGFIAMRAMKRKP